MQSLNCPFSCCAIYLFSPTLNCDNHSCCHSLHVRDTNRGEYKWHTYTIKRGIFISSVFFTSFYFILFFGFVSVKLCILSQKHINSGTKTIDIMAFILCLDKYNATLSSFSIVMLCEK